MKGTVAEQGRCTGFSAPRAGRLKPQKHPLCEGRASSNRVLSDMADSSDGDGAAVRRCQIESLLFSGVGRAGGELRLRAQDLVGL
jgi:hypothetical protein